MHEKNHHATRTQARGTNHLLGKVRPRALRGVLPASSFHADHDGLVKTRAKKQTRQKGTSTTPAASWCRYIARARKSKKSENGNSGGMGLTRSGTERPNGCRLCPRFSENPASGQPAIKCSDRPYRETPRGLGRVACNGFFNASTFHGLPPFRKSCWFRPSHRIFVNMVAKAQQPTASRACANG